MLPSFPYPSLNSLQKRSSIASERPISYKTDLTNSFSNSSTFSSVNNNSNSNNNKNNINYHNNFNHSQSYLHTHIHQHPLNFLNNNNNYSLLSSSSSSINELDPININNNTNNTNNLSSNSLLYNQSPNYLTSTYFSNLPLYSLDWTISNNDSLSRIALGSYREDSLNKLEILYGSKNYLNNNKKEEDYVQEEENGEEEEENQEFFNFNKVCDYSVKYPITRLQWDPSMNLSNTDKEILATTSECLRIYEIITNDEIDDKDNNNKINRSNNSNSNKDNKTLTEKATLTNSKSKNLNQLPPMTSFDWNRFDPNHLITCSIDTTCTVWDLIKETFVAKTQLIAHDSEVFDVKYIYGDSNVFTSCSSDGSVRLFDLRNLEQSTIIYENLNLKNNIENNNLLRISNSNYNANQIAVLTSNSNEILILDLRNVGIPLYKLNNNSLTVNSISWHPNKNILLSGSDDCQILTYDFTNNDTLKNNIINNNNKLPNYVYSTNLEVNYVCWNPDGDWVGFNNGKQFQAVQYDFDNNDNSDDNI